jgi:transcriptional regulator with XRE-family HTH domain
MNLGDKIRQLREERSLTQGQLANQASVSQGYLSQLENSEVKNPSAAVLLRVAQAMGVDPDELFEAAGYPTVRTLRQIYEGYESTVDADLLRYLARLPRDRQRRLLLLLEGMETVLSGDSPELEEAPPEIVPQGSSGEAANGSRLSEVRG